MEEDMKIINESYVMHTKRELDENNKKLKRAIKNVLKELDKKDEIINKAIEQIEYIRQYFSEDCQADFIGILEILKDKKVIDW